MKLHNSSLIRNYSNSKTGIFLSPYMHIIHRIRLIRAMRHDLGNRISSITAPASCLQAAALIRDKPGRARQKWARKYNAVIRVRTDPRYSELTQNSADSVRTLLMVREQEILWDHSLEPYKHLYAVLGWSKTLWSWKEIGYACFFCEVLQGIIGSHTDSMITLSITGSHTRIILVMCSQANDYPLSTMYRLSFAPKNPHPGLGLD